MTTKYNGVKLYPGGRTGKGAGDSVGDMASVPPTLRPHAAHFLEMRRRSCTERWAPASRVNPRLSRSGEQSTFLMLERTQD